MLQGSRERLDFIVGLFVLVAAIGVVFIALRAANIGDIGVEGYEIRAQFEQVGGLTKRSPVRSAGVIVGRVRDIKFINEDFVAEVILVIERDYQFPVDSIFSIESSNLLGGQYVGIDPGGDEESLQSGAVVNGNSAIVLEHLISKFLFDKAGEE